LTGDVFNSFNPALLEPDSNVTHLTGDVFNSFNPALLALAVAACSVGSSGRSASAGSAPSLDTDRVLEHVAHLAKSPRVHDTDAARAALGYIEHEVGGERFAVGDVTLPAIDVFGIYSMRGTVAVHTDDPDLLVRFGPPGKALLLTAHYDSVPGSPGATDNAVAVGLLIELAHELRAHPPSVPVMLAFTADEEFGLVGAEALAAASGDIEFVVALDLLGGDGDLVLNGASTLIGTAEMRWLAKAADRAGVIVRAPLPQRVVSRWWPQLERSDHGAFTRRGIRAVHLYNRGNDGEAIDVAYHSPHDTPARVDRASVAATGRLVRALVDEPPPPHAGDGFWLPLAVNTVVPRAALLGLELLLVVAALAGLVRLIGPRERGGLGLIAGIGCYVVAVAIAAFVERVATYPGAWLLAPLPSELAVVAVIAGAFGLVARAAARWRRFIGGPRYLALAIALTLAIGIAWLATGAAELAWIWLIPAATLAFVRRWPLCAAIALLPLALVLAPSQVREAAWNGFLPAAIPAAVLLGGLGASGAAAGGYLARRGKTASGPLGTLGIVVGCGLAVVAGSTYIVASHPACNSERFEQFNLACERGRGWP
jgi:hypothetical protein